MRLVVSVLAQFKRTTMFSMPLSIQKVKQKVD